MAVEIKCSCGRINRRPKLPKKLRCGGCGRTVKIEPFGVQKGAWEIKARASKYGKRRTRCLGGCSDRGPRYHDSKAEARYCDKLNDMRAKGEISNYISQKTYLLYDANDKVIARHRPDFTVYFDVAKGPAHPIEIHEVKSRGTVTEVWKLKVALFRANNPSLPYEVIWVK